MTDEAAPIAEEWANEEPPVQLIVGADGTLVRRSAQSRSVRSVRSAFQSVFLPQGFPDSVSRDYVEYQIWDSMQALCSYSTNTISVKAMLKGMGVGDDSATASAALVTWLMKDGCGMIGRIVFAWAQGNDLDNNSKQWRLVADAADDGARILSLLAPAFPQYFRATMCLVQLMYAVVGVAGGATRNAVTQHQSRMNNSGDVSAKDGSQETMVTLVGLCIGMWATPRLDDRVALTWCIMLIGSCLHIYCNYRAVRCLQFDTFNERRASIAMECALLESKTTAQQPCVVPTPAEMAQLEPIFSWSVQWPVCIGKQISDLAVSATDAKLLIAAAPKDAKHLIGVQHGKIVVCLRRGVLENDILLARFQAEILRQILLHSAPGPVVATKKLCGDLQAILQQHSAAFARANGSLGAKTLAAVLPLIARWSQRQFRTWEAQCLARGWRTDRLQLSDSGWRATWGDDIASEKSKSS